MRFTMVKYLRLKKRGYLNPVHVTAPRPATLGRIGNSDLLPVAVETFLPTDMSVDATAAFRTGHLPLAG